MSTIRELLFWALTGATAAVCLVTLAVAVQFLSSLIA
jgi:hypothetical protein